MSDFPRVRITGGPMPTDVVVVDAETGTPIEHVIDATWHCAPGELATVTLTLPAEVDVVGERPTHEDVAQLRRRGEDLARGIRSLLSSLPYQPREAIGEMAGIKLRGPLAAWDAFVKEDS